MQSKRWVLMPRSSRLDCLNTTSTAQDRKDMLEEIMCRRTSTSGAARKRNGDEDAKEELYSLATVSEIPAEGLTGLGIKANKNKISLERRQQMRDDQAPIPRIDQSHLEIAEPASPTTVGKDMAIHAVKKSRESCLSHVGSEI